jgi:hypothetical protein
MESQDLQPEPPPASPQPENEKPCSYCRKLIDRDAPVCHHCRYHQKWYVQYLPSAGPLVSVLLLLVSIGQLILAHQERKVGSYPAHTARGGKWLVFVSATVVDDVWRTIKRAVEEGKLGGSAKVSTAKPNPYSEPSKYVICVYTYDATDTADVQQIRSALRELGVKGLIPYKTDEAERQGKYRKFGHTSIALYYE